MRWPQIVIVGWLACAAVLSPGAAAADAVAAQREIAGLIDAIGGAGCRFERNGDWHDAGAARAHLQRKYDWLRKRGLATTAEQFIARAASRSSRSGRPYHVRCPGQPVLESAAWFDAELRRRRAAAAARVPR